MICPRGINILAPTIPRSDSPLTLYVGLCERCGLHSANAYNSEHIEGLTRKRESAITDSLYCRMFGIKSGIIFMYWGQQMKHILHLHGAGEKSMSLILQPGTFI